MTRNALLNPEPRVELLDNHAREVVNASTSESAIREPMRTLRKRAEPIGDEAIHSWIEPSRW